jgi:hypothetical protein
MASSASSTHSFEGRRNRAVAWLLVVFGALLLVGSPTFALYSSLNAAGIYPGAEPDQVIQNADGTVSYFFAMPITTYQDLVWPAIGVLVGLLVIALGVVLLIAKPKSRID